MGHPITNDPRAVKAVVVKPLKDGKFVTIHSADYIDLPKLGEIYTKVYSTMDIDETWTPVTATEMLKDLYENNPALALIAEVDGQIVGGNFCDVKRWQGKQVVDAREIFVDPIIQHAGVGAQLLLEGFYRAKKFYNATEVELITFANEGHARGFYEELGIKPESDLILMSGELEQIVPKLISKTAEMA